MSSKLSSSSSFFAISLHSTTLYLIIFFRYRIDLWITIHPVMLSDWNYYVCEIYIEHSSYVPSSSMYTISIHFVQFAGETSVLSRTEQCCSIDLTCFSRSIQYTFSCFIQCNEGLSYEPCSTVLFAYIAAHIYSSYLGFQFEVDAFNAIPSNMKTYKP